MSVWDAGQFSSISRQIMNSSTVIYLFVFFLKQKRLNDTIVTILYRAF